VSWKCHKTVQLSPAAWLLGCAYSSLWGPASGNMVTTQLTVVLNKGNWGEKNLQNCFFFFLMV
jgi:hypothetical protein